MRKALLFIFMTLVVGYANGQKVQSSCEAPDSIKSRYSIDAARLALRYIKERNLVYKDSAVIPKTFRDTALNALIAVYNATTLQARDTVVEYLSIQTSYIPLVSFVLIKAQSSETWMQKLKAKKIPTGNASLDKILSKYNLKFYNYKEYPFLGSDNVTFSSDIGHNMQAIAKELEAVSGVEISEPVANIVGDEYDIKDSVYSDHVTLLYRYGWGDCQSGCIYNRYWKFNVYYNCSVEYVGSYGPTLPPGTNLKITNSNKSQNTITVFPVPFGNTLFVRGVERQFDFSIYNTMGQEIVRGKSVDNSLGDMSSLHDKVYYLTIRTGKESRSFKIMKD